MSELSLLILMGIMISPFVVYQVVKLGTVAFFRGRQFFNDSVERKRDNDEN